MPRTAPARSLALLWASLALCEAARRFSVDISADTPAAFARGARAAVAAHADVLCLRGPSCPAASPSDENESDAAVGPHAHALWLAGAAVRTQPSRRDAAAAAVEYATNTFGPRSPRLAHRLAVVASRADDVDAFAALVAARGLRLHSSAVVASAAGDGDAAAAAAIARATADRGAMFAPQVVAVWLDDDASVARVARVVAAVARSHAALARAFYFAWPACDGGDEDLSAALARELGGSGGGSGIAPVVYRVGSAGPSANASEAEGFLAGSLVARAASLANAKGLQDLAAALRAWPEADVVAGVDVSPLAGGRCGYAPAVSHVAFANGSAGVEWRWANALCGGAVPATARPPVLFATTTNVFSGALIDMTLPTIRGTRWLAGMWEANSKGGVNGRNISLLLLDDGYNDTVSALNVEYVAREYPEAVGFVLSGGTGPSIQVRDVGRRYNLPLLFPASGSKEFSRYDVGDNASLVVNTRLRLRDEVHACVDHLNATLGTNSSMSALVLDNSFGHEIIDALRASLAKYRIKLSRIATFPPGNMEIMRQKIISLMWSAPDVIALAVPSEESAMLIGVLDTIKPNITYYLNSVASNFASFLGSNSLRGKVYVTQVFPLPNSNPEFQAAMAKHFPQDSNLVDSFAAHEGFLAAQLTVEALRRAPEVNRSTILSAFSAISAKSIGDIQIHGVTSACNEFLRQLWLTESDAYKLRYTFNYSDSCGFIPSVPSPHSGGSNTDLVLEIVLPVGCFLLTVAVAAVLFAMWARRNKKRIRKCTKRASHKVKKTIVHLAKQRRMREICVMVIIALIIIALVVTLLKTASYQAEDSVQRTGQRYIEKVVDSVKDLVDSFTRLPIGAVKHSIYAAQHIGLEANITSCPRWASYFNNEVTSSGTAPPLLTPVPAQLSVQPFMAISALYIGLPNGDICGLELPEPNATYYVMVAAYSAAGNNNTAMYWNLSAASSFPRNPSRYAPYSYRSSHFPWYVFSQNQGHSMWSPVFISLSGEQQVAYAQPLYLNGKFAAVFAAQTSPEHMAKVLSSVDVSANGMIFLTTSDGSLITCTKQESFKPVIVTDSADEVIRCTANAFANTTENPTNQLFYNHHDGAHVSRMLECAGSTQIAVQAFAGDTSGDDYAFVVSPLSDYIDDIRKTTTQSMAIGISVISGIILCVLVAMVMWSSNIRKSLMARPPEKAQAMTEAEDAELLAAPREDFEEGLRAMGVALSKQSLTFGVTAKGVFPVNVPRSDEFEVTNQNMYDVRYRVLLPHDPARLEVSVSPSRGRVPAYGQVTFAAEIKMLYTSSVHKRLKVEFSSSGRTAVGVIDINLEGAVSERIDPDEIVLFMPPLSSGAYGTVYRGSYRNRLVAVKVLKRQLDLGPEQMAEFLKEIDLCSNLRCPYIVEFVGASHVMGKLCLCTELVESGNLARLVRETSVEISYALKLRFALDIAQAMRFLHSSHVLHRDLKPSNVLVVSTTITSKVCCKLGDFGTSRNVENPQEMFNYTLGIGTPSYMAPEILNGGQYNAAIDVYSFAIVLWELQARSEPWKDTVSWDVPRAVIAGQRPPIPHDCPVEMESLIRSCWDGEPDNRPTFNDIAKALKGLLDKHSPGTTELMPVVATEECIPCFSPGRESSTSSVSSSRERSGPSTSDGIAGVSDAAKFVTVELEKVERPTLMYTIGRTGKSSSSSGPQSAHREGSEPPSLNPASLTGGHLGLSENAVASPPPSHDSK
eukprot:m51a1_g6381 putative protein kinase domain containing protein (1721) ;mRNA; f:150919-157138